MSDLAFLRVTGCVLVEYVLPQLGLIFCHPDICALYSSNQSDPGAPLEAV